MVVMLVWRIFNCKSSSAAMVLRSWPGLLLERIFIIASKPRSLTSTSAKQDLISAVSSRRPLSNSISFNSSFGRGKGGNKGDWDGWIANGVESPMGCGAASLPIRRRLFWDSKHWSSCSNSLTNSIAPPIIDAWSPCKYTSRYMNHVTWYLLAHF